MKSLTLSALIASSLMFTGCSVLQEQVTKSAKAVAEGVDEYCANFNQEQRAEFRKQVNEQAKKGQATVICTGDN